MAETSPSMHLGSLDRPKTGSCGVLVPGGECRVVDIETRRPVPIGAKGEIQVRGPQLMRGYLGRDLAEDVDDDGWFATGDVGYLDEDAYLFLVDRVKDVFKVDNWLVAPTDIERVLLRHPGVADCVVVDQPDEIHGAAPHALVVPSETGAQPADLIRFVAAHVPEHERLRHVELVEGIPRSPIGKVDRRALRARLAARRAGS
jgi:long-chain acyl-CoA synthetase